jgi:hypothetical protein
MPGFVDVATAVLPPLVRNVPQGIGGSSITIGNILQVIGAIFSGGTLLAILKVGLQWRREREASSLASDKAGNEKDASLRADLIRMLAESRADHAREIAAVRKEQADERRVCEDRLHSMQTQIDGLVRQLVAFQISSNRAMGFSPEATASADRVMAAIVKRQEEGG